MRRADRLLLIVQALRRRRGPTTAAQLAEELEVSRRTIYRDVLDLQSNRVPIEGEAGVGYVLRPGYDLPPLMFTVEEVEAIVLGARLVRDRGDAGLTRAADDVLAKVAAVLPAPLASALGQPTLLVPPRPPEEVAFGPHLPDLRRAVRGHAKVRMRYVDEAGRTTERVAWPLPLLFYSHVALLGAWCALREDTRFFRTDRIARLDVLSERFDPRGGRLLEAALSRFGQGRNGSDPATAAGDAPPRSVPEGAG